MLYITFKFYIYIYIKKEEVKVRNNGPPFYIRNYKMYNQQN